MFSFQKVIQTIDCHTGGEAARILLGFSVKIPGESMLERWQNLAHTVDEARKVVFQEPRGYPDLTGAILIPALTDGCHYGVVFCYPDGYLPFSGHACLGVGRMLAGLGMVELQNPITRVFLDLPVGVVELWVATPDLGAPPGNVVMQNVPSFVYDQDMVLKVPGIEPDIHLDIVFAGSFCALINPLQFGLEITSQNAVALSYLGTIIREHLNRQMKVSHPLMEGIRGVEEVVFFQAAQGMEILAGVYGNRRLDRSPSGTGTSARMVVKASRGELKSGEHYFSKSITGSRFEGWVVEAMKIGEYNTCIPYVAGKPYIVGMNQWLGETDDPQLMGFKIPEGI